MRDPREGNWGDLSLWELDQLEAWDLARRFDPSITLEQFEQQWQDFVEMKQKKALQ